MCHNGDQVGMLSVLPLTVFIAQAPCNSKACTQYVDILLANTY